jgi:hypothetical protein
LLKTVGAIIMVHRPGDNRVGIEKRIWAKFFPSKVLFEAKDSRQAGAGVKMGLLSAGLVIRMNQAGTPCPVRLITSNCYRRSFDHADLPGD